MVVADMEILFVFFQEAYLVGGQFLEYHSVFFLILLPCLDYKDFGYTVFVDAEYYSKKLLREPVLLGVVEQQRHGAIVVPQPYFVGRADFVMALY
jgi:hypothetical protein